MSGWGIFPSMTQHTARHDRCTVTIMCHLLFTLWPLMCVSKMWTCDQSIKPFSTSVRKLDCQTSALKCGYRLLTGDVGGHKQPSEWGTLRQTQQQKHHHTPGQTQSYTQQTGQTDGQEETSPTTQPEDTDVKHARVKLHSLNNQHTQKWWSNATVLNTFILVFMFFISYLELHVNWGYYSPVTQGA